MYGHRFNNQPPSTTDPLALVRRERAKRARHETARMDRVLTDAKRQLADQMSVLAARRGRPRKKP